MKPKICKIHGELSQGNIKSGLYKNKPYKKCRLCEIERSRKYYSKKYTDKEFVKNKHEYDNNYYKENKNKIQRRRSQPKALEKRRKAYENNAEKYRKIGNENQKKYREELAPPYMKKIIQNGDKSLKFSMIPDSLVKLKRAIICLKKGIKKQKTIEMEEKINEIKEY